MRLFKGIERKMNVAVFALRKDGEMFSLCTNLCKNVTKSLKYWHLCSLWKGKQAVFLYASFVRIVLLPQTQR